MNCDAMRVGVPINVREFGANALTLADSKHTRAPSRTNRYFIVMIKRRKDSSSRAQRRGCEDRRILFVVAMRSRVEGVLKCVFRPHT